MLAQFIQSGIQVCGLQFDRWYTGASGDGYDHHDVGVCLRLW